MSILTDDEIADAYTTAMAQALRPQDATAVTMVARAIEAAVIKKLARVSVEPHEYVWEPDGTFNIGQERCLSPNTGPCHGWNIYPVYTATAIAAARVQAIEEAAKVCESIADEYQRSEGGNYPELKTDAETGAEQCEYAIRALVGGPT